MVRMATVCAVLVMGLLVVRGPECGAARLTITPADVLKAPLTFGKGAVENDAAGPYLCGGVERGSGFLAYLPLEVRGARRVVLTPDIEVANPFGDRSDWVGVDVSFDGVHYEPAAAVKGRRGRKKNLVKCCQPAVFSCEGRTHLFLRVRIGPWWYRRFPRFRGVTLEVEPRGAAVGIDREWGRDAFLAAFRREYAGDDGRKAESPPHVIYLCGPVAGILFSQTFLRQEPVDAIVGLTGGSLKGWSEAEIVALAELFEAMGIPFMLRAGIPGRVTTTPDVTEKVFRAAPACCRGLFAGEVWNSDVAFRKCDELVRLIETAQRCGKKFVWFEHGRDGSHGLGWWGWCIEHPDMFAKVFSPRFRDTLVPLHENNDPRSQMANLGIVLGTWLQGTVREWGASVQTWWWNDAGYGKCPTCPPELITRMLALYLALGATWFEIEGFDMFLAWDAKGLPVRSPQAKGIADAWALLRRGDLQVPDKTHIAAISPVGFVLQKGVSGRSVFDPQPWLPHVPPSYLPARLYGVADYREELLPLTPYGFVPLFSPLASAPTGILAVDTDGRSFRTGDRPLSLSAVVELVRSRAENLPFASDNACVAAWRERAGGFRILLLHPQEKDPGPLSARIIVRIDAGRLRDLRTGERFTVSGGTATVPLSAARRFRILAAEQ